MQRDGHRDHRFGRKRLGIALLCLPLFVLLSGCSSPERPNPCPPGMAFVSGGYFDLGSRPDELDLAPMGIKLGFVPLTPQSAEVGDFCMDQYEYPNIAGVKPVSSITFLDARTTCLAEGKRLCTEREFDRACGGLDAWPHPYGPHYLGGMCNSEVMEGVGDARWLAPSGSFWRCESPEGIFDLDGNLSEWVDKPEEVQWPPPAPGEEWTPTFVASSLPELYVPTNAPGEGKIGHDRSPSGAGGARSAVPAPTEKNVSTGAGSKRSAQVASIDEGGAAGAGRSAVPSIDESGDQMAVVRGGTMWNAIYGSGCQARHFHPEFGPTSNDDGFRCCLSLTHPRTWGLPKAGPGASDVPSLQPSAGESGVEE